jgi:hypothetical protein
MRQDMRKGDPADASGGALAGAAPSARAWLSWRGLARLGALGDLLVLAVVGIGRGDMEAVAIAVLLLVAAALAGWRRGLVGLVALSLLFIDVTAFMLPAAVSNAGAGETLGGVALPASLAAMSLTGLIAAVAAVALGVRRRRAAAGAGGGRRRRGAGDRAGGGRGGGAVAGERRQGLAAARPPSREHEVLDHLAGGAPWPGDRVAGQP